MTRLKKLLDQCSLHTHRPAFSTGPSSTDQTQSRPVSLHASTTPSPPSSDQSMMHADEDDADERPAVAVDVVAGAGGVPSSCARAGGAAGEEAVCCFSPATGFHSAKEAGSWPWDWRASLASAGSLLRRTNAAVPGVVPAEADTSFSKNKDTPICKYI